MIAAFGGGETPPSGGGENAVPTAGGLPGSPGRDKRGQDTKYGFLSPLDSPYLPFGADTSKMCSETGVTGARFRASVRFWDAVMP